MASTASQVSNLIGGTSMSSDKISGVADKYVDYFSKTDKERKENYADVVNSYYDLATDFYEYGWGTSFHFATSYKGEPLKQAIARHEHYLALKMGIKSGDKILDTGCGVGGPAREIARFANCNVLGLNNNAYQVKRATMHTEKAGLADQVKFVKGDFMAIPQADNSFDGVYAIEATCHAPNKEGIYSEIFRVLKPGQCFAAYEWCMTESYNPDSEEDRKIKHGIEVGDGIPDLHSTAEVDRVLKEVGFEILDARDLADESEIPWYQPLVGSWGGFSLSDFRKSVVGRWCTDKMVRILETLRLAPAGTSKTHDFLIEAADNLVAGGKKGIFTPMYFFVVRKPLN